MEDLMRDPFDDGQGSVIIKQTPEETPMIIRPVAPVHICDKCQIHLVMHATGGMYCTSCGFCDDSETYELDISNENDIEQYNTSESSSMSSKVIGPGRNGTRMVIHSSSGPSNTQAAMHRTICAQITAILNRYSQHHGISQRVVSGAADIFCQVQPNRISRGDVRKGILAACLSRSCQACHVVRTPREIAKMFGITQSDVSRGEKILDEMQAFGLVPASQPPEDLTGISSIDSLLDRYFNEVGMEERCQQAGIPVGVVRNFCQRLVKFTKKYYIGESSADSSKCVGSIYIYSKIKTELKIDRSIIERDCGPSRSTFTRFAGEVQKMLSNDDPRFAKVRSRLRRIYQDAELMPKSSKISSKPAAVQSGSEKRAAELAETELPDFLDI